jgi:hypothetical protein
MNSTIIDSDKTSYPSNRNYEYLCLILLILPIIYLIRYFKIQKQHKCKVKILKSIHKNSSSTDNSIEIEETNKATP